MLRNVIFRKEIDDERLKMLFKDDTLFNPSSLIKTKGKSPPLVVVGLPRSGSSYLSELISRIEGWYVFDDLYLQRRAREIGANKTMLPDHLDELLFFLGWQIRARLKYGKFAIPNVAEEEVETFNDILRKIATEEDYTWIDLQEEWMRRLALRRGALRWGYKLPQAFVSIDILFDRYPEARFIFLLRNPIDVLLSLKYIPMGHIDGHPDNYHPIFYALYWRRAARAYKHAVSRHTRKVMLVTFDEVTKNSEDVVARISEFLDSYPSKEGVAGIAQNSSFTTSVKTRRLTGLETHIVNLVAGSDARDLGFELGMQKIRLSDFGDLAGVTSRFVKRRVRQKIAQKRSRRPATDKV